MPWHTPYLQSFTGLLKLLQVMASLLIVVCLSVAHYNMESNYITMRPPALLMAMLSFSFFITSLAVLMSVVMGSTDVPYTVFYRVHGVLGTVAFIIAGLSYVSQVAPPPVSMGVMAASLCIINSLAYFADTIIAYEPPIENLPEVPE
ncbi:uncharacterized protein LOC135399502 [Ornithodoros turicata]|uniref:uncharacterized protein LOC135399502 n=1 Tax=Ornithodoros turicata TaxID=34597 RepID=UPI0031398E02